MKQFSLIEKQELLDARIMFVALSPGVQEDARNKMLIDPSEQVLNKLLQTAGKNYVKLMKVKTVEY